MTPYRKPLCSILLGLALAAAACRVPSKRQVSPYPPLESSELGSMHNVSVSDGFWFGGQPTAEDLDLAQRRGIERVIAVVEIDPSELALSELCAQYGLECIELGVVEGEPIPDATVDRTLALLDDEASSHTLMFCPDGSWCAMLFAIHRVVQEGMSVDEALVEAHRSGMRPGESEEFVRASVARLVGQ